MSCVSTPTSTQFSTVVTTSVSTSFTESVTTIPGTTSTVVTTSCLQTGDVSALSVPGDPSCISSTVITTTTVIGGGTSTTQVPVATVTDSITSLVPTNTLFAPCTDTTSSTTSFTDTSTTIVATPTTTITSSSQSTLADGQVTQVFVTLTSVLPPTSSVVNTSVPAPTTQAGGNGDSNSGTALGAIIGGSVGGFLGLLAIVGVVWFFRRRRNNFDDIFEKDYEEYGGGKPLAPSRGRMLDLEDEPIAPKDTNTEPKPYIYGLVGSRNAAPQSLNAGIGTIPLSPGTPGSRPSTGQTTHTRASSLTPLMASSGNNNNAASSRPGSSVSENNSGGGHSPTPSFGPSMNVMRSTSPGPLGVSIPTGPVFGEAVLGGASGSGNGGMSGGGDSPTSMAAPRGPLFIANQFDPISSPATPTPDDPRNRNANASRSSLSAVAGPSSATASRDVKSPSGIPPAALAYLADRQRQGLQRSDTTSSASVYSQPSRAPSPPLPPQQTTNASGSGKSPVTLRDQRRRESEVVVHKDAGRVTPPDQPPAYQD
ncbi:uncharacterized protein FOMMEDRAFT_168704 [Fomitiporia mediterranea MF3/22]|uniref:uncharacterized protein n=1 Tax=Fomitiporia mediterranea (strain MF3/22) TaxID=694068 RepID=UPI0004407C86|nr:uncharacterized protein FOMMEDRAFT_168704 [Fomitiporia mediterranea MF3/22]EJD02184.1 hypothetical protein FOMMEDRAFT_168704 [Fomitiporia mediterranea MF3/22]